MKYEMIIETKDGQTCAGKCTYLGEVEYYVKYYRCVLFKKTLNSKGESPKRCGDCKMLCETFEKLPEIEYRR